MNNNNRTKTLNNRTKTLKDEKIEIAQAQIIVCTMGKFYDYLFNREWITSLKYLKAICIDEFDSIITSRSKPRSSTIMNTEEQAHAIIKKIPEYAQRVFFSATVSDQAKQVAYNYFGKNAIYVGEPLIVSLETEDFTLEGIRQYYVKVGTFLDKKGVLLDLLQQCRISQAIIFANKKETANELKLYLDEQEISFHSAVCHGDLSAIVRQTIHKELIEGKLRLLISTDLTARGLDIQGINVVINFDMPDVLENYIHRIGRSGRYGRKGVAINLILVNSSTDEMQKVERINEVSKAGHMVPLPEDLANLL